MRISLLSVFKGSAASTVLVLAMLAAPSAPKAAGKGQAGGPGQIAALGLQLFTDTTLSDPPGVACVTCHSPTAGFSSPNSEVNSRYGPVPGSIGGRYGFRKPPTIAYATFLPTGVPVYVDSLSAYVGGLFYDGRASDLVHQSQFPVVNPNEMNNLVHNLPSPAAVIERIEEGPSGPLFKKVYGSAIFQEPTAYVYNLMSQAIAAYEGTPEVSPFSSKYDAYLAGKATLTPDELRGLREVTGSLTGRPGGPAFRINAHCSECHGIPSVKNPATPDLWTNSCYANLGVPRNYSNPYYEMTNPGQNPAGYNRLGAGFIDYGLGDFMYPLEGKPSADLAEGDPLQIDGTFKTPTLRNVDARPYGGFVKCYMHSGVFKSLQEVVHFYNTRNQTTYPGEVIDFTKANPYANLKGLAIWGKPEWPSPTTMINPQGLATDTEGTSAMGGEQIGNMGLAPFDEQCIVEFLQTLTDGYFHPAPPPPPPISIRP
jgi:cytochrome c peroxidase